MKVEKGIEQSKASERTGHKALRIQYFRRRLRKIEVLKVLVANGLCPKLSNEELRLWHLKKTYPKNDEFMLWQRINENAQVNPYYYRHICLYEKLDMDDVVDRFILGRALYHLAQRRGFLSNRLNNSEDDKESGKVKTGISNLEKEIKDAGCEYLGDFFYKLYAERGSTVRIRNRYTDREEHYRKEFYAICEMQQLDCNLINALERALYFQRPLKSQRKGVGKCTFEPRKPRIAESHPDYEEFRMLCFINNIKIKTPSDIDLRKLTDEEKKKIEYLFYRKSKSNFDFEDIAKAIADRNNYQWIHDDADKPYKFNYRMTQGVSGCPTIANLIPIFGDNWKDALAETYTRGIKKDGTLKSLEEIVNDIWNVLFSFSSKEKLKEFAANSLQLDEVQAKKFSEIKLSHSYASLSLKAIRKILPFLREGMIYSHAVLMANVPTIVSADIWNNQEQRNFIKRELRELIESFSPKDKELQGTLDFCIKDFLRNNYELAPGATDILYHPSMIETYVDAKKNADGVYQLGSPRTNAIRNPMAMRSFHQIRKIVNQLLREKVVDCNTEVHVEYARELNDANKRKAIADYDKKLETKRKSYCNSIIELYKKETGEDIEPTETEILRFQLWEEQKHICIYTGKEIGISQFLGSNPQFDIEHTIPRSVGGDSTNMNLTLCDSVYNRTIKQTKLPTQLANHDEILVRIAD
ncbi:MAG: CRISPR-associated protein Csn1 [Bacteroides sp.]|nr:CRISPR-associated protein Csn1 [Bacteroides sp.]